MRYPRYLLVLDIFGFSALASATLFTTLPDALRPAAHLDDLWGNASTELVGIWVSVRLIDFIIKRNETTTRTRVRIVRGMRWVERLCHNFQRNPRSTELYALLRDYRWNVSRLDARRRHLSQDEVADVDAFFEIAGSLVALLPPDAPRGNEPVSFDVARFDEGVVELEFARGRAEGNILEETDEDSGLP